MFVVWLIGLVLAVIAPVAFGLAVWYLFDAATRHGASRALYGGAIGAVVGLVCSTAIEFVAERRTTWPSDYWYAYMAAGFTLGVKVALLVLAVRAARARAAEAF